MKYSVPVFNLIVTLALSAQLYAQERETKAPTPPTYNVLYSFTGGPDGAVPGAGGLGTDTGLVRDEEGNLYGVTYFGGGSSDSGVVFKIDRFGKQTVLHTFTGLPDGANPTGGLTRDREGNLYGTTSNGGVSGFGTVFRIDTDGKETILYSFTGGADGLFPLASLIRDNDGNLYGTTNQGGNLTDCFGTGCGVVFKLDRHGKETVLHTFTAGEDGAYSSSGLVEDEKGNLFGTTSFGGSAGTGASAICGSLGCGVVFKLAPDGEETVLHRFTGGSDGATPAAGLVPDEEGGFFGTAAFGGLSGCFGQGCGVVFKLDRYGNETVLYSFTGNTDGSGPYGRLIRSNGRLFGTTFFVGGDLTGPCGGCGVVFQLDHKDKFSVLYSFTGGADGGIPSQGLATDGRGHFYGTADIGGDLASTDPDCGGEGCGVVFKLTLQDYDDTVGDRGNLFP